MYQYKQSSWHLCLTVLSFSWSFQDYVSLTIELIYHIQPNYRTVRLGFSILLEKLVVKYASASD